MPYKIPKEIDVILKNLEDKGFEAYLVGGCVRDLLLNRQPKDWDITTNANPEEIQGVFRNSFYENDFGTVGVKTESEDEALKVVEITPYRRESKYSDNRHPDTVTFSEKLEDDLKRRDFTINAIAMDSKGQIIDPYKGQVDLNAKTIKAVGDPDKRFQEDALRLLRAVRLSSELGFFIDSDTSKAILSNSKLLKNVSRERIGEEFKKIVKSDNPMVGMEFLSRLNLIEHVAPILKESVGVSQNKQAHKYDVWEHSLRSLQHATSKGYPLEIRLAALFHDVAKPATKRVSHEKTTFYGHEVLGAKFTRETLSNLKLSKDLVDKVVKLVRWHMFFSDPEKITLTAVRRMIARVGQDDIWDLMNLRICDRIGSGRPKEEPYRFRKYQSMIEEALRAPISVGMLKIDGNILMKQVGIPSGPKIGNILYALFDEVLEDPEKNTEDYLIKKATELNQLPDDTLRQLGDQGKQRLEDEDEKELEEIRKKHSVK